MDDICVTCPNTVGTLSDVLKIRTRLTQLREIAPYNSNIDFEIHENDSGVFCILRIYYAFGSLCAATSQPTIGKALDTTIAEVEEKIRRWKKDREISTADVPDQLAA